MIFASIRDLEIAFSDPFKITQFRPGSEVLRNFVGPMSELYITWLRPGSLGGSHTQAKRKHWNLMEFTKFGNTNLHGS